MTIPNEERRHAKTAAVRLRRTVDFLLSIARAEAERGGMTRTLDRCKREALEDLAVLDLIGEVTE